jgi:hypothetical protein
MQVYIMLDENEDGSKPVIALSTASREGEDFLKKLPNINLLKEVRACVPSILRVTEVMKCAVWR